MDMHTVQHPNNQHYHISVLPCPSRAHGSAKGNPYLSTRNTELSCEKSLGSESISPQTRNKDPMISVAEGDVLGAMWHASMARVSMLKVRTIFESEGSHHHSFGPPGARANFTASEKLSDQTFGTSR